VFEAPSPGRVVGRYAIYDEIASGGMATVHLGRLLGSAGFARTVAIKKLHPHFAKDEDVVSMLMDEARLAARISHPNVVPVLEMVAEQGEVFLVLEYVAGLSLGKLIRESRRERSPVAIRVAAAVMCGVLHGLHAAHEALSDTGEPLGIVHRDVSPQNILVGVDGAARVIDFGVAKARGRSRTTRDGNIKGKVAYMPPEQLKGQLLDRRTDVYAAGVVMWELLTLEHLFDGPNDAGLIDAALTAPIEAPSALSPHVPPELDAIVLRALSRDIEPRYKTAREMALALEAAVGVASNAEVADWVKERGDIELRARSAIAARVEASRPSRPAIVTRSRPAQRDASRVRDARNETLFVTAAPHDEPIDEPSGDFDETWVDPDPQGTATQIEASLLARPEIDRLADGEATLVNELPPQHTVVLAGPSPSGGSAFAGPDIPPGASAEATLAATTRTSEPIPTFYRDRRTIVVGLGVAFVTFLVGVVVVAATSGDDPPAAAATSASSSETAPVPVAPATTPTPTAAPLPSSVESAKPPPSSAVSPSSSSKTRKPDAQVDCKPPFWIDSSGHKHYKPHCI
jgi:serine/threonine-protein kinase